MLYEARIYFEGFGIDTYLVSADDIEEAEKLALQRAIEETDYTEDEIELISIEELEEDSYYDDYFEDYADEISFNPYEGCYDYDC